MNSVESVNARNSTQRNNNTTVIPDGYKLVPINSSNSESDEEQETGVNSTKSKQKIQIFRGLGDKVSI